MLVKRICKTCGKEFSVSESKIKSGGGKYCSNECRHVGKRNKIKRICPICGEEFSVYPSGIKRGQGKYCSRKCMGIAQQGENNPSWKGGKVKCVCKTCGEEFYVSVYEKNNGGGKYCSRECMSIGYTGENSPVWKGGQTKCICQTCGEEFFVITAKIKNGGGKYCSKKCMGIANRGENGSNWKGGKVKCICKECGKEFEVIQARIRKGEVKYCSTRCRDKALGVMRSGENNNFWKGGVSFEPYCPKFNMRRKKAVRNFFNNTCLACGKLASENVVGRKIFALCVHHADHDKEQGCNGKPFNLVPLCHDCHGDELNNQEEYRKYINKTLEEGFKWGIWNKEEYIKNVMYPED